MKKITLLFSAILAFSYSMNGQTKKFANAAPSVSTGITATGSTDADLTTKTRMTASSLNPKFIELRFPDYDTSDPDVDPLPANTTTYVKVAMQDSKLATLLGGSLSDLLTNVLGGLVGDQQFQVQAKNTSTIVLNSDDLAYSNYAGDRLRVIKDSAGDYYLMVTPSQAYNRIRITTSVPALSASKWFDLYDAFYIQNTGSCGIGNYTSFNGGSLVTLADTGVTNPQYAIDADLANHSDLSLGLLGTAAFVEQSVYFEGPSQASDKYYVKLKLSPALVQAGLLQNIQLVAHKNGSIVSTQGISALLTADLLGLLALNQPITIPFSPGSADRITVRMSGLLNVSISQVLELYGIVKGNFGVTMNGGGTCIMNASMPLSLQVSGCSGPYTYSWDGVASSNSGAQPSTTTPGTYTYTATVTDKYGMQQRATTQITVEEPPVAGAVSGGQTICANSLPPDLTLSGYTGSILWWEKSASPTFATVSTIANTTDVLTGTTIGEINETTYFRAVVKHNSYAPVYSEPVAVTVNKTTWDGYAWSNGAPDISTTIYIIGDFTATEDLYGCSMHVYNNATVIIPSGLDVTLYGALKVNSGSFTLQSNANLVQQTNAVNEGNIIVERYSSLLYRLDYTLWSSPVTGTQTLQEFSAATMANRFYIYRALTDAYLAITPDVPLGLATGYLIRMPNNNATPGYNTGSSPIRFKGRFTGVPNNGTLNIELSQEGNRYSAVGNPYPSAINVHDFIDANQGAMSDEGALYFWRKKNNYENSSYATITKLAYTSNHADGGDTSDGIFTGAPSTWVISPGQGFIIQARESGNNLVFTNSMRRGVNNNQFFRTAQNVQPVTSRFWINLLNDDGAFAQAAVGYTELATTGIDFGWDGRAIINDGNAALYTSAENIPLAVQARPTFDAADVVPLTFRADNAGSYSMALDHFDGVFAEGQDIFLRDNFTGEIASLKETSYGFTTEAGTFAGRFDVLYAQPLSTDMHVMETKSVMAYKDGDAIAIMSGTAMIESVSVYDTRGRLLHYTAGIDSVETRIDGLVPGQVLILKIFTDKGEVSKKIVF